MGLSQSQARELFEEVDALRTGHFSLTSGRHSGEYWEKFWILQWPSRVELLCGEIAGRFRGKGIETVLGPTTGGILLAFEIARQLEVRALYAEMENGKRTLRRGLGLSAGERALVVDDVTTTSGSLKECIDLVRSYEAIVAGVAVLVDRREDASELELPVESVIRVQAQTFSPRECPLCAAGVPLTEPGKGWKGHTAAS